MLKALKQVGKTAVVDGDDDGPDDDDGLIGPGGPGGGPGPGGRGGKGKGGGTSGGTSGGTTGSSYEAVLLKCSQVADGDETTAASLTLEFIEAATGVFRFLKELEQKTVSVLAMDPFHPPATTLRGARGPRDAMLPSQVVDAMHRVCPPTKSKSREEHEMWGKVLWPQFTVSWREAVYASLGLDSTVYPSKQTDSYGVIRRRLHQLYASQAAADAADAADGGGADAADGGGADAADGGGADDGAADAADGGGGGGGRGGGGDDDAAAEQPAAPADAANAAADGGGDDAAEQLMAAADAADEQLAPADAADGGGADAAEHLAAAAAADAAFEPSMADLSSDSSDDDDSTAAAAAAAAPPPPPPAAPTAPTAPAAAPAAVKSKNKRAGGE